MINISVATLIGVVCLLGSCQQPKPTADQSAQTRSSAPDAATITGAPTAAAAQAMVARYLRQQPQAALYQLDSMRVLEVEAHWQVLVPRTDWARRMPNAAAFEVDKQTGRVTAIPVK